MTLWWELMHPLGSQPNSAGRKPMGLGPRWPPRPFGLGRTDHDLPMRGVWDARRGRRRLLSAEKSRMTGRHGAVQNKNLRCAFDEAGFGGSKDGCDMMGWVKLLA